MALKEECAAGPGRDRRAGAGDGIHILPRDRGELMRDLCGLAVAVPFGIMILWAGVAF